MNDRHIVLDPRLSVIAELVGECESYADIGCDHGRLGAFLLQTGRVQRAVLTDISADSLKKARRLIGLLGLNDRVEFRVGDGARALDAPPKVAVIAGMGGALIARLIREGRESLGDARLILQANVAQYELRRTLMDCGYAIVDERIVPDGRRNYVIIAAVPGEAHYSDIELTVGPVLFRDMPAALEPYARFQMRVAQKALEGARAGGDMDEIMNHERTYFLWKGVLECLQA